MHSNEGAGCTAAAGGSPPGGEAEPAEGQHERDQDVHGDVVSRQCVDGAVLVVLHQARPQDQHSGQSRVAAVQGDHGGAGEVVVAVQACGVCHTDLHYREGGINDEFPFLLGHEAAGIVEAVGPDVTDVAPGDFVILNWRAVCGSCRACLRGRPWYCFNTHNAKQKMTLADGTPLSPALGIGAFAEKTLVAAGIPIATGTDAGNPLTLHGPAIYGEMDAMQASGMTPMQVIVASTATASRAMGLDKQVGTIEKGKRGDLVVLDGDPTNNFLERATAFNPGGILNGAVNLTIAGTHAYILADRGLVVVSLEDPLKPKVVATVGAPDIVGGRAVAVQFRYAYVTDAEGFKVIDVTFPDRPRPVPSARIPLGEARGVYPVRTFAYVAAGAQGPVIVNIEQPDKPVLDQVYDAYGAPHDARDVKVGMVSSSQFAFVADGKHGMKVIQLFSPADNPQFYGFSPRPTPKLIARFHTRGPALAISEGVDRDRAVDESGNQLAVFGRMAARPFNKDEMQRMYLHGGELYTVTDGPPGPPLNPKSGVQHAEEAIPQKSSSSGGPDRLQ